MTIPPRPVLIVLHGFNSAGSTEKAEWLRENLPEMDVRSPTYSHNPMDAMRLLRAYAKEAGDSLGAAPTFLGTSLGGFYARRLARDYASRAVLLNPVIDPSITLEPALGPNLNFKTGERYVLERGHLQGFAAHGIDETQPDPPTLVLLDMADELLDSQATARHFEGRSGVEVVRFAGGEHRFTHLPQALPLIRRHVQAH
jgi:predicted esterase YcpF (UPF0227 family)